MSDPTPRRKLAAILAADVVGFSLKMGENEDSTLKNLKACRAITDESIRTNHGRIFTTAGDSVIAEFASPVDAIVAAVEFQKNLMARNAACAEEDRMQFRVGLNLGDVIVEGDNLYGDGVNVAARIEATAEAGGITVSAKFYEEVRRKLDLSFESLGEQQMKNIADPISTYRVNLAEKGKRPTRVAALPPNAVAKPPVGALATLLAGLALRKTASAAVLMAAVLLGLGGYWGLQQYGKVAVNPLSIAVLPFANLTGDAGQAYVADGLTNRVTSDLGRIQDAVVTDAGRVLPYKDKTAIVQQVAKELGVRFILQGDVQRSADKILINAKLTDSSSNKQLWSESFEGELSDLFALQDKVTHRISGSLGPQLLIIAASESETRKTNPQASDLVLRARALIPKGTTLAPLKQRETLLRQALALEPNNIEAMAGLSRALVYLAQQWPEPSEREKIYLEGRDLALKVKEIDPKDKDIYASLYQFAIRHDDLAGAIENAEKILSINPKDKSGYITLASALISSGDSKKAIELLNKGISLDPLNLHPNNFGNMSSAHLVLGDIDTAITWSLKASQVNPDDISAWVRLAVAYAMKGESEKAAAAVAEVLKLNPKFKLSNSRVSKPMSASPPAYKEWYEKKFLPAARKAGLPE